MKTQVNKTFKKSLILITIALLLPSLLLAKGHRRGGSDGWNGERGSFMHHQRIWKNPELIDQVGLKENQVNALKEMDFEMREKRLKQKSELGTLRLAMEKAFSQQSPDQKEIRDLAQKVAELKGQGFIQRIESRLKVVEILTPEQFKKLQSLPKRYAGKSKRGHKSHRGGIFQPFK